MNSQKKDNFWSGDDWEIANQRPEEKFDHPRGYWTKERILRLLKAKGQARIQHKLSSTTLNHLYQHFGSFEALEEENITAIDIGCGLGFSVDILLDQGMRVVGIDLLEDMISLSLQRPSIRTAIKAGQFHLVLANATHLPFRKKVYSIALSISAVQWIIDSEDIRRFAQDLHLVLENQAHLAFQLFPKSKVSLKQFGMTIQRAGFEGGIVIDNPDNPKKRRFYIIMKKK